MLPEQNKLIEGKVPIEERRNALFKRYKEAYSTGQWTPLMGAMLKVCDKLGVSELWLTDFPERALEISQEIGRPDFFEDKALEYFIDDAKSALWKLEETKRVFNVDEFCDLALLVHRKCGPRVRGWFTTGYGDVVASGISPSRYCEMTLGVVEKMGRRRGAFFAYGLPVIARAGGDPQEFLDGLVNISQAARERSYRKTKIFKAFVSRAPVAIENDGLSLRSFTQHIVAAIRELDEETAFSAICAAAGLSEFAEYDYTINELQRVISYILETRGKHKPAARWYAWGIDSLRRAHQQAGRGITSTENQKLLEKLTALEPQLDPHKFTEQYLRLLDKMGSQAAVIYALEARFVSSGLVEEMPERITEFSNLPQELIKLRGAVSKKVFREALWHIPKTRGFLRINLQEVFQEIISIYELEGEDEVINRLRYAAGAARNHGIIDEHLRPIPKWRLIDEAWEKSGFLQPPDHLEGDAEEEPDWDIVITLFEEQEIS